MTVWNDEREVLWQKIVASFLRKPKNVILAFECAFNLLNPVIIFFPGGKTV